MLNSNTPGPYARIHHENRLELHQSLWLDFPQRDHNGPVSLPLLEHHPVRKKSFCIRAKKGHE